MIDKNMTNVQGQPEKIKGSIPAENKQNLGQPSVVYNDEKLIPREQRVQGEFNQPVQKIQNSGQSNLTSRKTTQNQGQNLQIQPENYQKQQQIAADLTKTITSRNQNLPSTELKSSEMSLPQKGSMSPKMEQEAEVRQRLQGPVQGDQMTRRSQLASHYTYNPAPNNQSLPGTNSTPSEKPENHPLSPKMQGQQLIHHQKESHMRYTDGELYGWNNKYNIKIPLINFDKNCKKCQGTGATHKRFHSGTVPCTQCYSKVGYCQKCYGTGTNFTRNKPCHRWHGCGGEKIVRKSSPQNSSGSERQACQYERDK